MAIARVQETTTNIASAAAGTIAYGSNIAAGSLQILGGRAGSVGETWSISDNVNGAWTRAVSQSLASHGQCEVWYLPNAAGGATTVSFTLTGAATSIRYSIHEYSGAAASSPLHKSNNATGSSGNPSGYGVSTTVASCLVMAICGTNALNTVTADTGFTLRATVPAAPNTRYAAEENITTSTGTFNGAFTFSDTLQSWIGICVAFQPPGAGGGTIRLRFPPQFSAMGIGGMMTGSRID